MGILQKIVKNDAMKSDPAEIYGWRVFALTASACFGGATFGIDIGEYNSKIFRDKHRTDSITHRYHRWCLDPPHVSEGLQAPWLE